jgi:predicted SprT family Zn-dependent metalloprotease
VKDAGVARAEFFAGQVPEVVLSFDVTDKRTLGHYVIRRNSLGVRWSINLNPVHFARPLYHILSTLLHELAHAWQHEHGTPSKPPHHNKEFREKCEAFGVPTDEGGHDLGVRHGSPFEEYCRRHGVPSPGARKKMVGPAALRLAVNELQAEFAMNRRRACRVVGLAPATYYYRACRPEPVELREKLKTLAAECPRWGYRRLHVLLQREGLRVNHKLVFRVYRAEGSAVRRKKRKRMASALRVLRPPPTQARQHWTTWRYRTKPITDSGASRSPIPAEADHRFRSKPIAERAAR